MTTHTTLDTHHAAAISVRHYRSLDRASSHTWLEITVRTSDGDRVNFVIHPDADAGITGWDLLVNLTESATAAEDKITLDAVSEPVVPDPGLPDPAEEAPRTDMTEAQLAAAWRIVR